MHIEFKGDILMNSKDLEKKLIESERSKAVLLSNLPGMAYRCKYDRDWTMLFVSEGCFELTGYKAESLLHNKELSFNDLINTEFREYLWEAWIRVLNSRQVFKEEYEIITATGESKWVYEQGQGVYDQEGNVEAIEGLIIDISTQKKREEEIKYLINHDFLTGLYNRKFIDECKNKFDKEKFLPLSIIIGDINGLKLINDAFGHVDGDKLIMETASILKSCCRDNDILGRTGGDEFTLLLPNTDTEQVLELLKEIGSRCDAYNKNLSSDSYFINISLGSSTKNSMGEDINKIMKIADDYMYKSKLLAHKSSHSAILSSIKATLFEKSTETENHCERLAELSKIVGQKLNLSQGELDELVILATVHDIGKVVLDSKILNKPGKLTEEEWIEMKKHPEVGYRIAMSSPELIPIAEFIFSHHEHWNGKGYPQGLKGEEIPLPSRILAVVDAFDAMTSDRPYRKAMTKEEAIEEIRVNAGIQFDPLITEVFIDSIS